VLARQLGEPSRLTGDEWREFFARSGQSAYVASR
jgi:hypothetical protein